MFNQSTLTSDRLVPLKGQVTHDVIRTWDGKLLKAWRIIGERGIGNKSEEELRHFLAQATKSLRQLKGCATHWLIKKEPLDFTAHLDAYEEKLAHTPFQLPPRAHEEVLAEMNQLTFLQQHYSVERYYVLVIVDEFRDMEQVESWFRYNQKTYRGEPLSFEETKSILREWYN